MNISEWEGRKEGLLVDKASQIIIAFDLIVIKF